MSKPATSAQRWHSALIKCEGQILTMQPDRLAHVRSKSVEGGRMRGLAEGLVHRLIDLAIHLEQGGHVVPE